MGTDKPNRVLLSQNMWIPYDSVRFRMSNGVGFKPLKALLKSFFHKVDSFLRYSIVTFAGKHHCVLVYGSSIRRRYKLYMMIGRFYYAH